MENKGIYHNGLSARQTECSLALQDDCIYIYPDNDPKALLIWGFKAIHSCYLNGTHLIVKYGDFPHQTLECRGDIAAQIYKAWSGNHLIRKAEGLTFSNRRTMALLLIFAFLILGAFTFFYVVPWMGEKAVNLVPIATEISLGESIGDMYATENELNDSASYYVREFVKQLELDDTYDIDVRIIDSDVINAFALPGGKIFIYSGIIDKMESYPELVALLGHEVTHVVNRHSLKSICRSAATSIFIASLFGDITGISSGILSQADQFKQLNYSRELETEADDNGLEIMIENKVDPQGMTDLLKLLKEQGAELPHYMKYLSTHPDTESRISNISENPGSKKTFPSNEKLRDLFVKLKRCI